MMTDINIYRDRNSSQSWQASGLQSCVMLRILLYCMFAKNM